MAVRVYYVQFTTVRKLYGHFIFVFDLITDKNAARKIIIQVLFLKIESEECLAKKGYYSCSTVMPPLSSAVV